MAFVSALSVSSTSSLLSSLRGFLTSTLSWTVIDTGVSGISDNFVVKSVGASGDRNILLKFGVSTAENSGLSCWAADGFNSATDVTSNATSEKLISVNSGAAITVWFEGDADHIFVGTNRNGATTVPNWVYGGLAQEFYSSVSAIPNLTMIMNGQDFATTTARVVETPAGTFNAGVRLDSLVTTLVNASDPNLSDGLTYLWPLVLAAASTDRVFGTLKNAYAVGTGTVHNTQLTAGGVDYVVFSIVNAGGTSQPGIAVRMA